MKTITFSFCLCLMMQVVAAQDLVQFFAHEECVKPSRNTEYEGWLKKIRAEYERTKVEMTYWVLQVDNNSYIFFSPMETLNLNGVYKTFADAETKIGSNAIQQLYEEKGAYINTSREFITQYLPQFSYLQPGPDDNFRQMMFWTPIPGKEMEAHKIAKEWVELHKSKKATNGYQTFLNVFGGEPSWVIVSWGKDHIDMLQKSRDSNGAFGDDGARLWERTMKITEKIYYETGWLRPDLAYNHKPTQAK